jgi:hypothetical protein
MTSEEMRTLYGSYFLNHLSLCLDDLKQYDETPEASCKRLINWLDDEGYCLARKANIATLMAGRP